MILSKEDGTQELNEALSEPQLAAFDDKRRKQFSEAEEDAALQVAIILGCAHAYGFNLGEEDDNMSFPMALATAKALRRMVVAIFEQLKRFGNEPVSTEAEEVDQEFTAMDIVGNLIEMEGAEIAIGETLYNDLDEMSREYDSLNDAKLDVQSILVGDGRYNGLLDELKRKNHLFSPVMSMISNHAKMLDLAKKRNYWPVWLNILLGKE